MLLNIVLNLLSHFDSESVLIFSRSPNSSNVPNQLCKLIETQLLNHKKSILKLLNEIQKMDNIWRSN